MLSSSFIMKNMKEYRSRVIPNTWDVLKSNFSTHFWQECAPVRKCTADRVYLDPGSPKLSGAGRNWRLIRVRGWTSVWIRHSILKGSEDEVLNSSTVWDPVPVETDHQEDYAADRDWATSGHYDRRGGQLHILRNRRFGCCSRTSYVDPWPSPNPRYLHPRNTMSLSPAKSGIIERKRRSRGFLI